MRSVALTCDRPVVTAANEGGSGSSSRCPSFWRMRPQPRTVTRWAVANRQIHLSQAPENQFVPQAAKHHFENTVGRQPEILERSTCALVRSAMAPVTAEYRVTGCGAAVQVAELDDLQCGQTIRHRMAIQNTDLPTTPCFLSSILTVSPEPARPGSCWSYVLPCCSCIPLNRQIAGRPQSLRA